MINLNRNWQLFLDDYIVARSTGLSRIVHHPKPMGVVIQADNPWETAGVSPVYIGQNKDGHFFAYYISMWWDCYKGSKIKDESFKFDRAHHIFHHIGYAVSNDGINWEKPDLGLVEAPSQTDWEKYSPFPSPSNISKNNNLGVPFNFIMDLGQVGNVNDPAIRFAIRLSKSASECIGSSWTHKPKGYFANEIPDFLNDPDWQKQLVDSGGNFDPRRNMLHFWDKIHNEWVALEQGVTGGWLPSREIARFSSKDLINWSAEAVLYPDSEDPHEPDCYDEPMSLTPFCKDGVILGLLSWFHSDRTYPDGGPILKATQKHPSVWPWARKGTNEMRITISRDGGKTWDRAISREPWISHGVKEDSYDRLVIGACPPLLIGDEDWFYMDVVNGDHLFVRNNPEQSSFYADRVQKHQIALYTQKHNRYVSLTTKNKKEILITKPLILNSDNLEINVNAEQGSIRVAAVSAESVSAHNNTTLSNAPHLLVKQKINGFDFDDCRPINNDSIAHKVVFKNTNNVHKLKDKPVCLLFEILNAHLYGFRSF